MKYHVKIFVFSLIIGLFSLNFGVLAQVGAALETGSATTTDSATDTAAAVPTTQITIQPVGKDCDINAIESAVLRLDGILGVNLELRKGFLIVDYDASAVTTNQMLQAIERKESDGKPMECIGKVVPNTPNAASETAAAAATPAATGTTPAGTAPAATSP